MLSISDIRQGTICQINGEPFEVIYTQHVQMGRGGAILRLKLKSLSSGNVLEKTLKGADGLEAADVSRSKVNFLYRDAEGFHFMDNASYEQFSLAESVIGDRKHFLKEGVEVNLLLFDGTPIAVQLPTKMEFTVTSTVPGIKGDTAQGKVTKPATIETGYQVNVPLFVKEGDVIRINTETGEYVERA
ncbi:MAG: elongation factor P [Candidatus Buchananbacteria bacterium RIFCSPLOWO2_01_FULL_56_15]|uniref:Elongation factor P n=1 Tax=Candidatus Buchananbacteria bacterium RIFCSPLOWO2_01_FULL_56_15 TaxID=1797547 RepID=A0A1G1YR90_9BACT|nr:MAG: elongation factor P [Candidatus Buchananbacteria bacterium RIFCSPLOWO2_01_FULL_56_15]